MATQITRIRGNRTDWSILLILVTLLVIGLIMIYSASYRFSLEADIGEQAPGHFAVGQAKNIGLGVFALLICWFIPYRFLPQVRTRYSWRDSADPADHGYLGVYDEKRS